MYNQNWCTIEWKGAKELLNKRQEKIIIILENSRESMTGSELSSIMNVTDRTIRSDIDTINSHYKVRLIESSKRTGYHINQSIFSNLDITISNTIPQTPKERCSFILHQLMFNRNGINVMDLQDQVFVSNFSIENDLKQIKKMIGPYKGLRLVNSRNLIYLEGEENCKRELYKDLLTEETKGNFLNLNNLASFYKDFDLLEVMDLLDSVLDTYKYKIQGAMIPMLMIHLGIAIERMTQNNYSEIAGDHAKLHSSVEYEIADSFYRKLSEVIPFRVTDNEVYLMASLLKGKKSGERVDFGSLDGKKVASMIGIIIQSIKRKFGIDFAEDKILTDGLQMHMQSLADRISNNQTVKNIYLKEIKWKYPLIFEMAIEVADIVNRELEVSINEDEIGFITLHLGAAYERTNKGNKYRAVLIQPHEQALSDMCKDKIISRFDERLEFVGCFDFFEEAKIKSLRTDIIISTLPLAHNLPIMTVLISPFVNYEDESKIFQVLSILDKKQFREKHAVEIDRLIDEQFFYTNLELSTQDEVINFMCDRLQKADYISEAYMKSVHEREKISATSFAYSFAIPHALNISSYKSNLSVAILKNPIPWGDYDVQLVIMMAIAEGQNSIMRTFFDSIGSVLSDSKEFAKLIKVKTRDEFVQQFMK